MPFSKLAPRAISIDNIETAIACLDGADVSACDPMIAPEIVPWSGSSTAKVEHPKTKALIALKLLACYRGNDALCSLKDLPAIWPKGPNGKPNDVLHRHAKKLAPYFTLGETADADVISNSVQQILRQASLYDERANHLQQALNTEDDNTNAGRYVSNHETDRNGGDAEDNESGIYSDDEDTDDVSDDEDTGDDSDDEDSNGAVSGDEVGDDKVSDDEVSDDEDTNVTKTPRGSKQGVHALTDHTCAPPVRARGVEIAVIANADGTVQCAGRRGVSPHEACALFCNDHAPDSKQHMLKYCPGHLPKLGVGTCYCTRA